MRRVESRIRHFRERRGVPVEQLARRVGVTSAQLRSWESGRGAPSVKVGLDLAAALGTSLDRLFVVSEVPA